MKLYSLKRWRWDIKPAVAFGAYEYGWVKCKSGGVETFLSMSKLREHIEHTYNLKNLKFKWDEINAQTEPLDYITATDRYRIIIYQNEIK